MWIKPSKHFLFSKASSGGLEDVFSENFFCFPRCLEDMFARCVPKTLEHVLKTFWRCLSITFSRRFQVFARCLLQDIFKKTSCNYVLTTSCRRLLEDKKMLHCRHHQDVFKTSAVNLDQNESLVETPLIQGVFARLKKVQCVLL